MPVQHQADSTRLLCDHPTASEPFESNDLVKKLAVEEVACPACGGTDFRIVAVGRDYEGGCPKEQRFRMVACCDCATYYLNPRPTAESLEKLYSADYYSYSFSKAGNPLVRRFRAYRDRRKIGRILPGYAEREGLNVLDIGCGDGFTLEVFRSLGVPPSNLVGNDFGPHATEKLRAQGFRSLPGRIEDSDLRRDAFDVVTILQVLEHVADPSEVLKKVWRAMRLGGHLLIETPNVDSWDRRFFRDPQWAGFYFPRHWTLWNKATVEHLLRSHGFRVLSLSTYVAPIIWLWSINHALQDSSAGSWLAPAFNLNNPVLMAFFVLVDLLPSRLGLAGNLRIVAQRV